MIDWYIQVVMAHPIYSSMIQFAFLGTLGEIFSHKLRGKKGYPFTIRQTLNKMVIWALLAITIKYAFKGFGFFVDGLASSRYLLPEMMNFDRLLKEGMGVTLMNRFSYGFAVSFFMNILFAPQMMLLHRLMDNFVDKKPGNYQGMITALKSIVWFWIPAHTVTFMLPDVYRIGLAAVWSVVLGVILGYASSGAGVPQKVKAW